MQPPAFLVDLRQVPHLLRGEAGSLCAWVQRWHGGRVLAYVTVIFLGAGIYGAAMGAWRAPLQAVYTALKFPLVILLTTLGNALLNGMLAPLLGLNIGFRQSLLAVLVSFTIASVILGSFAPLVLFVAWNTPLASSPHETSWLSYCFLQLLQVTSIAYAGVLANVRLLPLLRQLSGSATAGRNVLLAWLAGNLFLGSQICWVLRPFIGRPDRAVEFLGQHPFQGSLYQTVFDAARQLLSQ